ncbi:hypothetical protein Tco_1071097 [Tanacetum coccineum]|uniref:Uncharacterized protein n=1 Tax=Tanacetum coccineum TaxID=301880 RepID=A0ABQ5HNI3_9ASTR
METSTQTTTSNTQRSSSPSPGEKEFMQREEQIERVLQNSSHEKQKCYPIFDKEQKLLVPSITVAQLGVSNHKYPDKEEKIERTTPTMDDLAFSLAEVLAASTKIGTGSGQIDKVKINYCSEKLLIYSNFQEKIDEDQLKILSNFEEQFETFSGLLALLPEDLKQRLCGYISRSPKHHCQYCSEGTSTAPIIED